MPSPIPLGFGVEIELEVQQRNYAEYRTIPKERWYDILSYYLNKNGVPSTFDDCTRWRKRHDYKKWWITRDNSIKTEEGCFSMEVVSPILHSNEIWETEITTLWNVIGSKFRVFENETAGCHVHVAPIGRLYTLEEVKAVAFASCYYEPYIISILPYERRINSYCKRNSMMTNEMGETIGENIPQHYRRSGLDTVSWKIDEDNLERVCRYMQGGMEKQHRYVLWNFQNLVSRTGTGTIEFRGGPHLRDAQKTTHWITFAVVFVSMAMGDNLFERGWPGPVPEYGDPVRRVQRFWSKLLDYAGRMGMRSNLPEDFRVMSEEVYDEHSVPEMGGIAVSNENVDEEDEDVDEDEEEEDTSEDDESEEESDEEESDEEESDDEEYAYAWDEGEDVPVSNRSYEYRVDECPRSDNGSRWGFNASRISSRNFG